MFDKYKALSIGIDAEAEYVFYGIEGEPSVFGKPATEANKPYLNSVLKKGKRLLRRMRGGKMSVEALRESREQDYELYPKHVVKRFGNQPLRDDGSPATDEDLGAFLRAIPIDMFDEMRAFYSDPDTFREEEDLTEDDVDDLGKD